MDLLCHRAAWDTRIFLQEQHATDICAFIHGVDARHAQEGMMEAVNFLIDFVLHIDIHLFDLAEQYGLWAYAILFVVVFCETGLVVTPFLPGDSLLFASGVAAGVGLLGYGESMLTLFLAGVLGDAVNYGIGRRVGPSIFAEGNRWIKKDYLVKAHNFYERHGGKAIVLARFVPIVRTFAPFVAGIALMYPSAFFLYNISGCVFWVGTLVSAGYFLGNFAWVRANFSIIVYAIIVVSVLPALVEMLRASMKPGHKG
jgi:membrane-associated protein